MTRWSRSRSGTRCSSGRRNRRSIPFRSRAPKASTSGRPRGKRFIDFNSQLMCVNIGHGDERVVRAIQDQAATLAYANPFMATEPRARLGAEAGRAQPRRHRRVLLHQRRRRGQRERRQAGAMGHRPSQDSRALPVVSRRDRGQHHADRRSAALGGRTGHSGCRPRARPVPRHRARMGFGRAIARDARGGHPARGPAAPSRRSFSRR